MRASTMKVVAPLLLVVMSQFSIPPVEAEDANYQDNQGDDYFDDNYQDDGAQDQQYYNEQEEVEEEAAVDDAYNTDDGSAYNKFFVCADAVIQVKDLQIYCDSPGTFYYGSGKYRNSAYCNPGDKAKILLDFYIAEPDVIESSGGYAIMDVSAIAYSGWYQQTVKIYENADMCSVSNLKSLSGSVCPSQGMYRIKSRFYWPEYQNGDSAFYPNVTVGFKSRINKFQYDYGGANTLYCRGSTFVTWTNGVRTIYANAISNFMRSFGILLITIVLMGGFIWFLHKKPTSVRDAGVKLGYIQQDIWNDEPPPFDFYVVNSPKIGQNLVDI